MRNAHRHALRLAALSVGLGLSGLPMAVRAQGSRVIITVLQSTTTGTIRSSGAAVCFTSTDYTKLTDAYGVVTFDNVPRGPVGAWSAVAWKKGYKARRADISVPGTAVDVRASITLVEPSLEASPCILPPSSAPSSPTTSTPPPTTSFPPHEAGKVTLVVTVYRGLDGNPLKDAAVCVGIDQSHPDSYAKRAYTDAAGRVVFHVEPVGTWHVTAGKGGFTGRNSRYYLGNAATYGIVEFRLFEGSGGPNCPLPVINPPPRR